MERLRIEDLCFHTIGLVNLIVDRSECIGITGPSGVGKTLFLRSVADMAPHTGKLFLDNTESNEMTGPEWRKKVGLLPSESSWWFDTVGEHFNSVEEKWFKAFGFDGHVMQWEVSRLSSGERQRLALLRLLCNRPKVLLLDEPTANLDSDNIMQAERFLSDYRLETESSVIWVSHDITQLKRVSSCHFILKDNQLLKI